MSAVVFPASRFCDLRLNIRFRYRHYTSPTLEEMRYGWGGLTCLSLPNSHEVHVGVRECKCAGRIRADDVKS